MKINKYYFENYHSVFFQRKTLCPKKLIQLSTGYASSDPPKYDYL